MRTHRSTLLSLVPTAAGLPSLVREPMWSDEISWLVMPKMLTGLEKQMPQLDLSGGWEDRWTMSWRFRGSTKSYTVGHGHLADLRDAMPVRRFTWRRSQRHRPGLQFMVSTGEHHGFESIAEQQVLLALDFAGDAVLVLSQPFRLAFCTAQHKVLRHIPDYLAATSAGCIVVDVRPHTRIGEDDLLKFCAMSEAALSLGWGYVVVAGWRDNVTATLDTLSSQRRHLNDQFALQDALLRSVSSGPASFVDLVESTRLPAVARAHALHLLWHRRLGVDLHRPLSDDSIIRLGGSAAQTREYEPSL